MGNLEHASELKNRTQGSDEYEAQCISPVIVKACILLRPQDI